MSERPTLAGYVAAPLEDWYRTNYFNNEVDISGSGVQDYSFAQVRDMANIDVRELDAMLMGDGPTIGREETRRVIAARFAVGSPSQVMIANGSNEALQLVVRSILSPGDEIVAPRPCYHCHDKIAASMGCHVRYWDLRDQTSFAADVEKLARLINSRTRALVLNFPNNPTGASLNQEEVDFIVKLCAERGIYLLWDAAFQELIYDYPLKDPVLTYERAISVGTFSKSYGLPGLRFGWIVAGADVIDACVRQKDYGNLYVAPLIEHIARKVLIAGDAFTGPRIAQARSNRDIVQRWSERHEGRVGWKRPAGGVCGLLRLPEGTSDRAFCEHLLRTFGVLLVPGSCFEAPGFARLGFGGESSKLELGLERLDACLRQSSL